MKKLQYEGKEMAYQVEGKGTPVVLLHGFCEDHKIWEEFQQDLREEPHQVILIDLPGAGASEVVEGLTIDGMAQRVHALLESLGAGPAVLIGHSMGGYVGLAFARLFPEALLGLGLFHSHPYSDEEEKKALRQKSVEFIQRQGHILFVKQMIPGLFAGNFARSNAFLLEKLIYRAAKFPSEGIIAAQRAMMARMDETDTLRNIEVPVLFIVGKQDDTIPADKNMAQTHLPAVASIHILEKAGHMGHFEARKATQRYVRQFVAFCEEKSQS
jgi:pimeloyl-ACP methyl ester carboxylesterase